jgi:predicted nucleic acid-binding Zn ribbon protein
MTYLYETIPVQKGEKAKQFEIKQSAKDAPLTKHSETGEPIRRVILGGWGLVTSKANGGGSSKGGCGCGPSGCC